MVYRHVKHCSGCHRIFLSTNNGPPLCPTCPDLTLFSGYDPTNGLASDTELVACASCGVLYVRNPLDKNSCPSCPHLYYLPIHEESFL